LLVHKPNKRVRFCVDYWKFNEITKKDVYSLPKIDDTLDRLARKRYYTTIDLAVDIGKLK
jgi:hypothetical protein